MKLKIIWAVRICRSPFEIFRPNYFRSVILSRNVEGGLRPPWIDCPKQSNDEETVGLRLLTSVNNWVGSNPAFAIDNIEVISETGLTI